MQKFNESLVEEVMFKRNVVVSLDFARDDSINFLKKLKDRRMQKFICYVLIGILFTLLSCNRGISSKLPGKWVIDGEPDVLTVEFFKDGRVVNTYGVGATLEGTWKVQSENTVAISMEPWDITGELVEKKLILKSGENEKIYRKIE